MGFHIAPLKTRLELGPTGCVGGVGPVVVLQRHGHLTVSPALWPLPATAISLCWAAAVPVPEGFLHRAKPARVVCGAASPWLLPAPKAELC